MTLRRWVLTAVTAMAATASSQSGAQDIRNYNVNFTSSPPTIDGTVSPGEWDSAAAEAGDWRELRKDFSDVDEDNNRFRILYDTSNLYILYETDYDFGFLDELFPGNPAISFGEENLNLYIDPNRDGDLNTNNAGDPVPAGQSTDQNVDGYQFAFNQYLGTHVSTDADRDGIGFYTEAHVNTPFGDQGNWNQGGNTVEGPGLSGSGIVVAQTNTNSPSAGQPSGIAELVIPFADLDADQFIPAPAPNADYNGDGNQDAADYTLWRDTFGTVVGNAGDGLLDGADGNDDGTVNEADYDLWVSGYGRGDGAVLPTGLNATDGGARSGPEAGEVWGFNISMITRDAANNFLPIWNWHDSSSFALWPHGMLTFQAAPGAGAGSTAPEPAGAALAVIAGLGMLRRRRRS
ncbi:hypothetical protein Pla123a_47650 [Posidoniimonas polymericola]|uniref:PEP-CTERM protein-sorting domain-containing protein n=1 Tax=Posidoniimonas polymericola TaxID=2528002 RepID=A0A5C5XUK8_9BACT|nr:hypothetical protein [Posidoniimonas polymericola]TWT66241.1 hypothetical protein Pla123a_47650 [Posidoniimonas polymericola]